MLIPALLALIAMLLASLVIVLLRSRQGVTPLRQALAEERLRQQEAMVRQMTDLSALLTGRLDAGHHAVGRRLEETGSTIRDLRERLGQLTEITRRLEQMGQAVNGVRDLLQVPKLRGNLGELWLEEMLRQVFPEGLYETQYAFASGERVDAVIRLGTRLVPVDAKFPLESCQRMLDAEGEEALRHRRAFRRAVRDRIEEIAEKYIRPDEATYDFALMYVPAEAVYYEAFIRDENPDAEDSALGHAMRHRVVPVSPHTFYAYLAAVLHGLRGLQLETRAGEIQAELGALRQDFGRFLQVWEKIGTHLGNARKQYREGEQLAQDMRERLARVDSEPTPAVRPDAAPEAAPVERRWEGP